MLARHAAAALAAAALLAIAPAARAQSAAPSPAAPNATAVAPSGWDPHPVGKYDLELTLPERVMPATLTVSDSAGKLVASFWPVGDNDAHEMSAVVKDGKLVLNADSPRGPVEITLERQGDHLTGKWSLGPQSGTLQGKVSH